MAAAAHAAVVSLMHILDQIPEMHMLHLDRNQLQILHENVSFLQDFLEVHSQRFYEDLEGLARQIAAVADETEHIIHSRVVDQLHRGSAHQIDMDLSIFNKGLDNVIEKIDSIKKELMMIEKGTTIHEQQPTVFDPTRSLAPPLSGNDSMVGFEEQFDRIVLALTGDKCDLQVLPIVGMGGISKTTLSRTAFEDKYIGQHFDMRIWVTISEDYSMKRILVGFLCDEEIDYKKFEESNESLAKLGERLYKKLYDRRYLVVMDDVWSTEVWSDLRSFFPDNSNGSLIMVTTRLSNVAVSFSSTNSYLMNFLDEDKSWDLFRKKAFAKDGHYPPELKEIGKSIAKGCKGLPLAIVVIGGLLSKSNMTREYWESIAKNVNSFANSGDEEHCLKILSLSYNNLPIHLKSCFLYMRVFLEDEEKNISELIRSWVVEGFLKPIKDKTLEEVARNYLEDLIGRNLILIRAWTKRGKMKTCGIHDLLRDLCIRESHRECFYHVPKSRVVEPFTHGSVCFLCGSPKAFTRIDLVPIVVSSQPASPVSCLVCDKCRNMYPNLNRLRLVKVLKDNNVLYYEEDSDNWLSFEEEDPDDGQSSKEEDPDNGCSFEEEDPDDERSSEEEDPDDEGSFEEEDPDDERSFEEEDPHDGWSSHENIDTLHLTTLRYFVIQRDSIRLVGNLIRLLWNLQTLIIHSEERVLPSEIWEMPQLRHLRVLYAVLPNPPLITQVDRKNSTIILKNLQTLISIKNFRWSEDAIERIPNLKKLDIYYDNKAHEWSYYSFHNLGRLHKLESLSLVCPKLHNALDNIGFLHSLKKLSLLDCGIPWKEMTIIGLLSNLEVLKLYNNAFKGPEWNPVEGGFHRLRKLVIKRNEKSSTFLTLNASTFNT